MTDEVRVSFTSYERSDSTKSGYRARQDYPSITLCSGCAKALRTGLTMLELRKRPRRHA